jgi:hypothetical protein
MWEQLTIDDAPKEKPLSFSASAVASNQADLPPEKIDTRQWGAQLRAVYEVMKDGRWRTLAEIAFHAKAPEASVSARIRDLARKGFSHVKRKAKEGKLYEYQLNTA